MSESAQLLIVVFVFVPRSGLFLLVVGRAVQREKFTTSSCTHPACGVSLVCTSPLTTVLALEPPSAQRATVVVTVVGSGQLRLMHLISSCI